MASIRSLGGVGVSYERAVSLYAVISMLAGYGPRPLCSRPPIEVRLQAVDPQTAFDDVVLVLEGDHLILVQAKTSIGKFSGDFEDCFTAFYKEWRQSNPAGRVKTNWVLASMQVNHKLKSGFATLKGIAEGCISETELLQKLNRNGGEPLSLYKKMTQCLSAEGGEAPELFCALGRFSLELVELLEENSILGGRIAGYLEAAWPTSPEALLRDISELVQKGAAYGATFTCESIEARMERGDFRPQRSKIDFVTHPIALDAFLRTTDRIVREGLKASAYESMMELRALYHDVRSRLALDGRIEEPTHLGHDLAKAALYRWGRLSIVTGSKKLLSDWHDHAVKYPPETQEESAIAAFVRVKLGQNVDLEAANLRKEDLSAVAASRAFEAGDFQTVRNLLSPPSEGSRFSTAVIRYHASLLLYSEGVIDCDELLKDHCFAVASIEDDRPVLKTALTLQLEIMFSPIKSPAYGGATAKNLRTAYQLMESAAGRAAELLNQDVGIHETVLLIYLVAQFESISSHVIYELQWSKVPAFEDYVRDCDEELFGAFAHAIAHSEQDARNRLLQDFLRRRDLSEETRGFVTSVLNRTTHALPLENDRLLAVHEWSAFCQALAAGPTDIPDSMSGPFRLWAQSILAANEGDGGKVEEYALQLIADYPGVVVLFAAFIKQTEIHFVDFSDRESPVDLPLFHRPGAHNRFSDARSKVLRHLYDITGKEEYLGILARELYCEGKIADLRDLRAGIPEDATMWQELLGSLADYLSGSFEKALTALDALDRRGVLSEGLTFLFDHLRFLQGWFAPLAAEYDRRKDTEVPPRLLFYPILAQAKREGLDRARESARLILDVDPKDPQRRLLAAEMFHRLEDYARLVQLLKEDASSSGPALHFAEVSLEEAIELRATFEREREAMRIQVEGSRAPLTSFSENPLRVFHWARVEPHGFSARRTVPVLPSRREGAIKKLLVDQSALYSILAADLTVAQVAQNLELCVLESTKYALVEWARETETRADESKWYTSIVEEVAGNQLWQSPYSVEGVNPSLGKRTIGEEDLLLKEALGAVIVHEGGEGVDMNAISLVRYLQSESRLSHADVERTVSAYPANTFEPYHRDYQSEWRGPRRVLMSFSSALILWKAGVFQKLAKAGIEVFWSRFALLERSEIYGEALLFRRMDREQKEILSWIETFSLVPTAVSPNSVMEFLRTFIVEANQWCTSNEHAVWTDDWALARLLANEAPTVRTVSTFDLIEAQDSSNVSQAHKEALVRELHSSGVRGSVSDSLLNGAVDQQLEIVARRLGSLLRPAANVSTAELQHHINLVEENMCEWLRARVQNPSSELGQKVEDVVFMIGDSAGGPGIFRKVLSSKRVQDSAGIFASRLEQGLKRVLPPPGPLVLDSRNFRLAGLILPPQ